MQLDFLQLNYLHSVVQLDPLPLEANKIEPYMGIKIFRTDHSGAYNDIYRVLVTAVAGYL